MKSLELIEILKHYKEDQRFIGGISIFNGEIDWDMNSRTTAGELIDMLKEEDPSLRLLVDVDDGYVYKSIKGIKEKYWSKDENILEFVV